MKYIASFDFTIQYTPGKPNVVADALSRKHATLAHLIVAPTLLKEIASKQKEVKFLLEIYRRIRRGENSSFGNEKNRDSFSTLSCLTFL